jgi:hypothetical protein
MAHKIKREIYAKQQEESWFQQQQQQYDKNQFLDFLNNVQPLISHQSHQDADNANVPLPHLPSSYDGVTTPVQTVSTPADVKFQKSKKMCMNILHFTMSSYIWAIHTHTHIYIYLIKVLCCIKNFITHKCMTETDRHAYKSLTLKAEGRGKL